MTCQLQHQPVLRNVGGMGNGDMMNMRRSRRRSSSGDIKMSNLKVSNLPKDLSDMDIILGLKQLIDPLSHDFDFQKLIFKRSRSGNVCLFVKFASKKHVCCI